MVMEKVVKLGRLWENVTESDSISLLAVIQYASLWNCKNTIVIRFACNVVTKKWMLTLVYSLH
jgi:hypothetical protein